MKPEIQPSDSTVGLWGLALLVALPFSTLLSALTIWVLWGWFAVPLGAPAIGKAHAYGLDLLLASFLAGRVSNRIRDNAEKVRAAKTSLTRAVFRPAALLGMGWITHCLMT